jgi:hypothetical protein
MEVEGGSGGVSGGWGMGHYFLHANLDFFLNTEILEMAFILFVFIYFVWN